MALLALVTCLAPVASPGSPAAAIGPGALSDLAGPAALAQPAAPAPGSEATIQIATIEPAFIRPGDTVRVSGTVTNTGTAPIESGEMDLQLAKEAAPAGRASLSKWAGNQAIDNWGWTAAATRLTGPIGPGASEPFTIEIPASRLSLPSSASAWGAYLARIDVATQRGIIAVQRTFLVWQPTDQVPPVKLATMLPLLAAPDPVVAPGRGATTSATSLERARQAVRAAAGAPLDYLVDPALLEAGPGNKEVAELAAGLSTVAESHDVYRLPWADADLAALADGDAGSMYRTSLSYGEQALERSKVKDAGLILWPPGGQITPAVASMVNTGPTPTSILLSSAAASRGSGETAPTSARALITDDAGTLPGVIVDDRLSAQLTGADAGSAVGRQRLAAELAAVSSASGGQQTAMLLVPPRDWPGAPERVVQNLAFMTSLPWVASEATHSVLLSDVSGNQVMPRLSDDTEGQLPARDVRQLERALSAAADYAVATAKPDQVLAPMAESLLFPLSTSRRAFTHQRQADIAAALKAAAATTDSISLKQGSTLNLIASSGMMPVSVTNNGTTPVNVTLRLVSPDYRLQADDEKTVAVAPGTEARATLQVKAVASGNVTLQVVALNKYDHEIAPRSSVTVRVRADWEDLGTLAVGLGFVALLIVGLFRSRRRKRAPKEQPGT